MFNLKNNIVCKKWTAKQCNILINQSMLWCLNEYVVCCLLFFQIVKAAWWLAQDLTLGIWMGFDAASSRSNWQLSCDIRIVVCQDIELCYWLITLMSELNQNAQAHRWIGGWLSTQVLIASWCNNKSCQSDFRVCFSCSLLLACSSCDGCDTDICTQCWWVVIVWLLAVVCCTSELFINFVWAWTICFARLVLHNVRGVSRTVWFLLWMATYSHWFGLIHCRLLLQLIRIICNLIDDMEKKWHSLSLLLIPESGNYLTSLAFGSSSSVCCLSVVRLV